MFTTRIIKPERLDQAAPEDAQRNLAHLVHINRRFGGYSTAAKVFEPLLLEYGAGTLLDVGSASGDVSGHLRTLHPNLRVTNLDANLVNAAAAPEPKLIANAFALPFAPGSFDYVLAALFLHHFSDADAVLLLQEFYRVASKAVIIIDLERSPLSYCFLPLTWPIFRWDAITLHDGPISVRAAFKPHELLHFAKRAGMKHVSAAVHRPAFRVSLVARKYRHP